MKKKLLTILFWSVISAAFIGPGTITTASKSGASFGYQLIWALLFSTIATIILQEAAARLKIASGKKTGQIIDSQHRASAQTIKFLLFSGLAFGCAAYQTGNILGALAGLQLLTEVNKVILVGLIGVIAFSVLWIGRHRIIANLLGLIVAIMGFSFLGAMISLPMDLSQLASGIFIPSMPEGSSVLLIGLVGTTIVPYNLFLASGLESKHTIGEMRLGLITAIALGGIISMAVLIVGTNITGEFSFESIAGVLEQGIGNHGKLLFAVGLFAAGLSSAITAPFAAAITAESLFDKTWRTNSGKFRGVWLTVLLIGLIFGLSEVQPIPAIILAQAINGVLLPLIVIFIFSAINNKKVLGKYVNSKALNAAMSIILIVTIFLGLHNLLLAVQRGLVISLDNDLLMIAELLISIVLVFLLFSKVFQKNRNDQVE